MGGERVYLDYAASAPVRLEAVQAVEEVIGMCGNPSSVHEEGRRGRMCIEAARESVACLVGAAAENVIFTSGATEANALGFALASGGCGIFVSAVEHLSVLDAHEHRRLVPVDGHGIIRLGVLEEMLACEQGPVFVSVMLANNETGVIQPVAEVAERVRRAGGFLHCDAAQAVGRIPVDMTELGVDALSLSSHKMGGIQGTGALVLSGEVRFRPLWRGGGQERGRRGGTENLPGIAALGAVARCVREERPSAALRDYFESQLGVLFSDVHIFAREVPRLPGTVCFALPGIESETVVMALDLEGVAVSSGAACSSGKVSPSHVLRAMGVEEALVRGAVRLSLGWGSTREDVDRALGALRGLRQRVAA